MSANYNTQHTLAVRRIATLLLPLALVLLTGCPPRGSRKPVTPPAPLLRSIGQAVATVNDNAAGITRTLAGSGIAVSASFHDDDRKVHRYDLSGTLRFRPPHYLYLDLGHSLEPSALRIGSNDTLFWVWVKPERNELWYGRWADLDPAETYRMPLPPDMVLAAMGLSPLPGPQEDLRGPVPQAEDGQYYKLLYLASSGDALWIQREYWLDRFAPYLPRVVVFRMPDGRVRMRSTLDRYERVGDSNVYIAREIRMFWPDTQDGLSMRMSRLSFKDVPDAAFQLDPKKTPIPRDRWVRVGNEPPTPAPTAGEPAATQPDTDAPTMELESSPE